ncbi:Alpha/beta hydrolase family [Mycobacteroides abscessus subsp. abscessus]|nr:Alpha/beta hydrolase family [Mycobacteroides abscessus subsp. abscessus]
MRLVVKWVAVTSCLLLIVTTLACSHPLYGIKVDEAELDGAQTLGLAMSHQDIKGLVVYFHGSDQTARVIAEDRRHTDFFDPILRAGYAVVAADAGNNAFGNPSSVHDYQRLIAAAEKHYGRHPMFFVAESMGAIAGLTLMRADTERHVRGMIGISPLMGLPPQVRAVSYIAGPWGGHVPDTADPLEWPVDAFAGREFRLYAGTKDDVIPADASARAFADRFRSVAHIEIIDCAGGHVAIACYQGGAVVDWMNARG